MSDIRLTMPRFFFRVEGVPDATDVDLPSVAQAKCEAARYAAKLLADAADTFWETGELSVVVTDEAGLTLFALSISGTDAPAIRITPIISA
jgi:uncharacterized protein DUF6894